MEKDNNTFIWIVIAVAVLLLVGSFGFSGGGYGMMNMMYGGYGTGMMFFGWIIGIAFLVALGLFIAWLVKQLQKK
jgi:uncharacterized membrane protein